MSTLVVVKKNGVACIAADTMDRFGHHKQLATYLTHPQKILCVGDAYIGIVGNSAHYLVMDSIFSQIEPVPRFQTRQEIFEFFRKLHPILKNEYFLNPKHRKVTLPYESSRFSLFIANRYGIFGVFRLREVFEYSKFCAIGPGSRYAFGALYAAYAHSGSAETIAKCGVEAGIEFNASSAAPITSYRIELVQ
jgi:ATP-dependent protease HslVU (ClpYQ) peptidase subunit